MQCANTLMQAKSVIAYALVHEIIGQVAGYFKPHERSIAPSNMECGQKRKKKVLESPLRKRKAKKWPCYKLDMTCHVHLLEFILNLN